MPAASGGKGLKYTPEFTLRVGGKNLGTFKNISIVGRVVKNKKPVKIVDYNDENAPNRNLRRYPFSVWKEFQLRMSNDGRWTEVKSETGRVTAEEKKNPDDGLTCWERRIKLILDGHEK